MLERHHAIPGVLDELRLGAADAEARLLLEVPHGATNTADFAALAARLIGVYPADLADFFHVNTDAGAPELAEAIGRRWVAAGPSRQAIVVRCRIPRTFVDCNRLVDARAEGGLTPGMAPYVRNPANQRLLRQLHAAYVEHIERAFAEVCGPGGLALTVHTYAPRSVDVQVGDNIVRELRAAWAPGAEGRWPLRPEVNLITRTPDGHHLAPTRAVAALKDGFAAIGVPVHEGETYPLHPATQAWRFATRYPGQILCFEVRRDALAEAWTPFAQMAISPAKTDRIATIFAAALEA